MEIRELRSLLYLAEFGSFTKCAEKLNLSVAAVHNHLKVLEIETGAELYRKIGRKLELTPAGEILLPKVKSLLTQYDEVLDLATNFKQGKLSFLRVGAGPTFSSYVLPQILREYSYQYPDVKVIVDSGQTRQLFTALKDDKLDLVILILSELSIMPEYMVQALWDFEVVLVSSADSKSKIDTLADLQNEPFILYKQGTFFESLIERYFLSHDFYPQVAMRFDNADAIKAMIKAGFGVSMLPYWAVSEDLESKNLHLINQKESPLTAKLALVTRRANRLPLIIQSFIDIAQSFTLNSKIRD